MSFDVLRRWAARMEKGGFVFTSNVDAHFQQARYPDRRIAECHAALTRPNILMFGDCDWIDDRTKTQLQTMTGWLAGVSKVVVVALGAGRAIPTVFSGAPRSMVVYI